MHRRLLAPSGENGAAHRAFDRRRERVEILSAGTRQRFETIEDRFVDHPAHFGAAAAALRQAGRDHVRIADHLALSRHAQRDRDDAGEGELHALAYGPVVLSDQHLPILEEAAGGDLADDRRRAGRKPHDVAVAWRNHLVDAMLAREGGVTREMMRLAMRGRRDLGPDPSIKPCDLATSGMARAVHVAIVIGHDLCPEVAELVDEALDLALIARDSPRGEDDAIASGDLDRRMIARGCAGQRRARLALAPRRENDRAVARQRREMLERVERGDAVEIAEFARDLDRAIE